MKKRFPKRNEFVVCKIVKINPHSAIAYIIEYDTTGLIHVSEVASRWVRDIREFIKEKQYVVCRVMEAYPDHISLSLKRVHREDTARKLNEFKRERRSEKLLEMVGKSLGKNLEQTKKEIGDLLIEEFGSLTKVFEFSLKSPDLLVSKGIPEKWAGAITEIAKKNFADKTFIVKGLLKLITYEPNGVEVIKKVLAKAKKEGLDVQYVSAPKYAIVGHGKNYKNVENKIRTIGEQITQDFEKHGDASFELEK
jgi:translation initiation factor 2 subunit 1